MLEVVREPASAKLNPFLRVLRRRRDGYHEIESLVQPITLADGVEARPGPEGVRLQVAGPLAEQVPTGSENLAVRAAEVALQRLRPVERGVSLLLVKRIPVAAGLGGGSSDAAATIRALVRLWGLEVPSERLLSIAAEVGSDVPALLRGGPVFARGRGERVEPVDAGRTWWILLTQPFGVSAADAYSWWDVDGGPTGPEPDALLGALRAGDPAEAGGLLFNDLEPIVAARHPEIRVARERLVGAGALGVVMCGSGPTVAGLARDGPHAEEIAAAVGGMVASSVSGPGAG